MSPGTYPSPKEQAERLRRLASTAWARTETNLTDYDLRLAEADFKTAIIYGLLYIGDQIGELTKELRRSRTKRRGG